MKPIILDSIDPIYLNKPTPKEMDRIVQLRSKLLDILKKNNIETWKENGIIYIGTKKKS